MEEVAEPWRASLEPTEDMVSNRIVLLNLANACVGIRLGLEAVRRGVCFRGSS